MSSAGRMDHGYGQKVVYVSMSCDVHEGKVKLEFWKDQAMIGRDGLILIWDRVVPKQDSGRMTKGKKLTF